MGQEPTRTSRRGLLAAAAGGASALAAHALTNPLSVAAASTAVMTETDNLTQAETSITADFTAGDEPAFAFEANIADTGTGLHGYSPGGTAIIGDSDMRIGVAGRVADSSSLAGISSGVLGLSNAVDSSGVTGLGEVGVEAAGPIGVFAVGTTAVVGIGDGLGPPGMFGTGVYGYSGTVSPPAPPNNVGVYARGDGASTALRVQGKASFSRSGRTYVSAGHSSRTVTLAGVTTSSLVLVTLHTRRTGVYVAAATPGTGRFTVYLNKAVPGTTYFAYFVLN